VAPVNGGSAPKLVVELDDRPDEIRVRLHGELDLTNADQLETLLLARFEREGPAALVFDMTELGFVDSSGLAVLLRAAARGKNILLLHPSLRRQQVIATTGLAEVLRVEP